MKPTPLFAFAASLALAASAAMRGQNAAPEYTSRTSESAPPDYSVPYGKPSVEDVTAVMLRVLGRVQDLDPARIVDSRTKQEITDLSQPTPQATADLGSYWMGVLHSGMLLAGEVTGDRRFTDYTAGRLKFLGERLPYFQAQADRFGVAKSGFKNFLAPTSLDSCGAWGAALVRARMAGVGPDLKPVIDRWADFVSHKQFRLADGTLARQRPQPESIWGDDMYMSVPFLSQLYRLTGDTAYLDDASRQVLQMSQRLFSLSEGLFAHAWSSNNADYNPRFHWGRANGWCVLAMCDLLDVMPENHPAREPILKILRAEIRELAVLESGNGLWHQLLDREDSFLETSCSAMFTYGMAHAVNRGWISAPSFAPVALAGWNGVASKVGPGGSVDGVCIGTNYASDAVYYYNRPHRDDPHGYGPVLLAGSEIIRMIRNDRIAIGPTSSAAEVVRVKGQ